ncbi:sulfite exporter TauE/SafE family protein [Aquipuribacter sp. MA13-6]|uniref:sulfite exporter TauE/SafE family protein n=1 Tax=Aquipuribacter sp. MA13-6 TaxID=3440839 RepID=UPI003EF05A0C
MLTELATGNLWLVLLLAVAVGVSLGLLGGGGSILAVPLLVYVAGLDSKEAIATSLLVVGVTSLAALIPHARAGRVRWRTGLVFGTAAMVGAYVGGRLAEFIPGTVLLIAFSLMMLATAVAMIRGRRAVAEREGGMRVGLVLLEGGVGLVLLEGGVGLVLLEGGVGLVLLEGGVVGLVTGMVGAGGGFLVVPALVLLGGLPMSAAVGTSLLVIAMKSFAGLGGYLASVQIDWALAAAVTAAAVLGSVVGGTLTGRIPADTLRRGFGWFVVVMGVFVLAQQAGDVLGSNLAGSIGIAAAVGAVTVTRALLPRRRDTPPTPSDGASAGSWSSWASSSSPSRRGTCSARTSPAASASPRPWAR